MAWVRIHDGAMSHPKILALTATAFRLWVAGLSYCQQHLTDGFIPRVALQVLLGSKADADKLVSVGLWHDAPDGYAVHDYGDWNDAKDVIVAKRASGRRRVTQHRARVSNALQEEADTTPRNAHIASGVGISSSEEVQEEERNPYRIDPNLTNRAVTSRVGDFIDRYCALYEKHRNGARYVRHDHKDYASAVKLCATWDDARLDKLAAIFLTTDHEWAERGSRTIPQFAALASWCDSKLTEWEQKQKAALRGA